jgi:chromodomain-helicase-DNA-binding protein 7
LLWKIDHEDPLQEKYLVKYANRSYLQTEWFTRAELLEQGFEISSAMLKSVKIKMRKTSELKLKEGVYFNPNYLLPDRILTSTEIFTAIHHKKANDIKGKWDESIMLVCTKLLNFTKDSYPYGVHFHEPYNE